MNLTGIQYIILNAYQFIDVARFAILDPETGTLWIDFSSTDYNRDRNYCQMVT